MVPSGPMVMVVPSGLTPPRVAVDATGSVYLFAPDWMPSSFFLSAAARSPSADDVACATVMAAVSSVRVTVTGANAVMSKTRACAAANAFCAVVVAVSAFTPACLARSLAPPISAEASDAALLASVAVLRTVSRSAAVTSALNVQLERVRPLPA